MAEFVYILCAVTSTLCATLLVKKYLAKKKALLLWTALAFGAFALNNALLVLDLILVPELDLSMVRVSVLLAGFLVLLYGLIWERV